MHLTRFLGVALTFGFGLAVGVSVRAQPNATSTAAGNVLSIKSSVLQEERSFQVFVPPSYKKEGASLARFPVLYVLDGKSQFAHVSTVAAYLATAGRIPDMIVIGIDIAKRNRDLTPTHTTIGYEKTDSPDLWKESGGSDKFAKFLLEELIPFIEDKYPTAPFRILAGQSLSGLFTVQMLFEHPDVFNAYLICSPSLWWDNRVLLNRKGQIGRSNEFAFISVANEGGDHLESIKMLTEKLKTDAVSDLKWKFERYPNETHYSVSHLSAYDGLMFIYSGWDIPALTDPHANITFSDIAAHYEKLSERYGYSIPVPEAVFFGVAARLEFQNKINDRVNLLEQASRTYPESSWIYSSLVTAYEKRGDRELALKVWQKLRESNPSIPETPETPGTPGTLAPLSR